jgi:hypothetical protein
MRHFGKQWTRGASLCALAAFSIATPATARLRQFIVEKTTPMADGYELLEGHFVGELDPNDKHNAIITDLKLAPRNASGKVEYSATFAVAMPKDASRNSGLLIYDVANRGHGAAKVLGNGAVSVVSGWQGDLEPGAGIQSLRAPVAPVTGPAFVRFIDMPAGTTTMPVKGGEQGDNEGRGFEVATAKNARLFTLASDGTPEKSIELPRSDWAFADCSVKPFPGTPDLNKLCVKGGFNPKLGYTLAFTAKNPKVLGTGFAATRDLVAFLRYDAGATNPLAGRMRWAIARGESQSGDYLRAFTNLGFNSNENGKIVFDGVMPIVAMRMIAMNYRFSAPGGLVDLYELGLDGADWWGKYDDRVRDLGRVSILDRCNAAGDCPKIMEIMGAAEMRYHRGSVDFVGTDAKADIPLPSNVRRYFNASVTHAGGAGGFSLRPKPVTAKSCVLPANPNPTAFANRALFAALIDWVTLGKEPPPSIYPTLAAGDLISQEAYAAQFPAIPGVGRPISTPLNQYDFSRDPNFIARDVSGMLSFTPPQLLKTIPLLVPRVDADGNEVAGIRSPLLAAPLGTYLGWNLTATGYRTGRFCFSNGSFIPFAATKAERLANGDPRPSIEERYPDHAAYVAKVKAQADALVAARYMLAGDAAKMVSEAEAAPIP